MQIPAGHWIAFALLTGYAALSATVALPEERDACSLQRGAALEHCRETLDLLTRGSPPKAARKIAVTGRQYSWQYDYQLPTNHSTQGGLPSCTIPGPLVLPAGEPVELRVTSEDIIHEWSVPALGLKIAGIPGRLESATVDVSKPGVFLGAATPVSGKDFRDMTIEVRVLEPVAYTDWERGAFQKNCRGQD